MSLSTFPEITLSLETGAVAKVAQYAREAAQQVVDNDQVIDQTQQAAADALSSAGVDPDFISYVQGLLPSSSGAIVGTIGAYFAPSGFWQKLEWNGSAWVAIGDAIQTRTSGFTEFNQVNFYDIASAKDNTQAFFKKNSNTNIDFLLPLSGEEFSRIRLIKDPNDDYVKIQDVDVVKTLDARAGNFEFDSQSGTFVTSSDPNHYASAVNSTLTFTFTGTGLEFMHLVDNRGGIWEFVLNGDANTLTTISTYNSTLTYRFSLVYKNLQRREHTVVATFKGDDPLNPPSGGTGTSRGWYTNDFQSIARIDLAGSMKGPFIVLDSQVGKKVDTVVTNILVGFSNKEFAFNIRLSGSSNARQFIPEHSAVGTTFGTVSVVVDGKNITTLDVTDGFIPFNICEYYQDMIGRNQLDNIDLCQIHSSMNVNSEGINLSQSFEWLQDTDISAGYVNMVPVNRNFGTRLIDSKNNLYDITLSDGSANPLNFRDNLRSVGVVSALSNLEDYILGVEFDNNTTSFLFNQTKYRMFSGVERRFWWEARTTNDLSKLYPQIFINEIVPSGFKHKAKMRLTVGKLKQALKSLS
jgi:hypothetical protein